MDGAYRNDHNLDYMRGELVVTNKEVALLKQENALLKKENESCQSVIDNHVQQPTGTQSVESKPWALDAYGRWHYFEDDQPLCKNRVALRNSPQCKASLKREDNYRACSGCMYRAIEEHPESLDTMREGPMIDKRGKKLLDELRDSPPELAPDPHRSVFVERESYHRVLERIQHVVKRGIANDRKPMTAAEKLAAITTLIEKALENNG